jgi:hypothetical protein
LDATQFVAEGMLTDRTPLGHVKARGIACGDLLSPAITILVLCDRVSQIWASSVLSRSSCGYFESRPPEYAPASTTFCNIPQNVYGDIPMVSGESSEHAEQYDTDSGLRGQKLVVS